MANPPVRRQILGSATSLVEYHSAGHCLIISELRKGLELAQSLAQSLAQNTLQNSAQSSSSMVPDTATSGAPVSTATLSFTIFEICTEHPQPVKRLTDTGVTVIQAGAPVINGYLGAFRVEVQSAERLHNIAQMSKLESGHFDLILDLSGQVSINARLAPFGYYAVRDAATLQQALHEIPQLIGHFEKPRYFDYDLELCAHSRSSLPGCTGCLDICATQAISSQGDGVQVNPYLCQGCGSCATVCPSGAMTYAWPRASDAISRTRELLDQRDRSTTVLLLYKQSEDEDVDVAFEQSLPDCLLPVAVEEVFAFGIDYWAAMLAAGIRQIVLLVDADVNEPEQQAVRQQVAVLEAVLGGLRGSSATAGSPAVLMLSAGSEELTDCLAQAQRFELRNTGYSHFATHNDKRQTFRMAIDEMLSRLNPATSAVCLAPGSPFGRLEVSKDSCTLCLACVSVCPAGALLDGQELPQLRFIESNCLQCGLCEQACPEQAISLLPRYLFDSVAARAIDTLHEEQPFHCVRCHKPFATRKMIDTLSGKLADHWMFKDEAAVQRLKMCEDCRVKDMFEGERAGIEVHRGS